MTNLCISAVGSWLKNRFQDYVIFESYANNVPMPKTDKFIALSPVLNNKLFLTNTADFFSSKFNGSVATNILTVESVDFGTIEKDQVIYVNGQPVFFKLLLQTGINVWQTTPVADIAITQMCAGKMIYSQPTLQNIQLDVYGADAMDTAIKIETTICDLGWEYFKQNFPSVIPLKVEKSQPSPFETAERNYLKRWIMELKMQYNVTEVDLAQQFFNKQLYEVTAL